MKFIFSLFLMILSIEGYAQTPQGQHPRVMELEDEMVKEISHYFNQRHPGDPFFARVKILPLRRLENGKSEMESLPYFDSEAEEMVDEWDDPTTPLNVLKNRVVKITVDLSVAKSYDEEKTQLIQQELTAHLRLTPLRDELRIENKLKGQSDITPAYVYYLLAGMLVAAVFMGIMFKWGQTSTKQASSPASSGASVQTTVSSSPSTKSSGSGNGYTKADVRGDVNFHDPVKGLEIAHKKIDQITSSKTFPTLRDVIELDILCKTTPGGFGGLIYEFPQDLQLAVFKVGRDTNWLQAFSQPSDITHACLKTLDVISRDREFSSGNREMEDLLIQCWRLGDKAITFFKGMDANDAFTILNYIPKSESLRIAKKAFPGSWGKLLENKTVSLALEPKKIQTYLKQATDLEPWYQRKLLENYRRDKEILNYLERVTIEDEKDIYETLDSESFILKVRPGFYRVFELETNAFNELINQFPIEKWALVMINSNRTYIKMVSDQLEDRKKLVFSTQLKRLDQNGMDEKEQIHFKRLIAEAAAHLIADTNLKNKMEDISENEARSA